MTFDVVWVFCANGCHNRVPMSTKEFDEVMKGSLKRPCCSPHCELEVAAREQLDAAGKALNHPKDCPGGCYGSGIQNDVRWGGVEHLCDAGTFCISMTMDGKECASKMLPVTYARPVVVDVVTPRPEPETDHMVDALRLQHPLKFVITGTSPWWANVLAPAAIATLLALGALRLLFGGV